MRGIDAIFRLLDSLNRRAVSMRVGQISGATSTRAVVTLGGGSISEVPFLTSYTPVVGDNVILLQNLGQLVIIGKVK